MNRTKLLQLHQEAFAVVVKHVSPDRHMLGVVVDIDLPVLCYTYISRAAFDTAALPMTSTQIPPCCPSLAVPSLLPRFRNKGVPGMPTAGKRQCVASSVLDTAPLYLTYLHPKATSSTQSECLPQSGCTHSEWMTAPYAVFATLQHLGIPTRHADLV